MANLFGAGVEQRAKPLDIVTPCLSCRPEVLVWKQKRAGAVVGENLARPLSGGGRRQPRIFGERGDDVTMFQCEHQPGQFEPPALRSEAYRQPQFTGYRVEGRTPRCSVVDRPDPDAMSPDQALDQHAFVVTSGSPQTLAERFCRVLERRKVVRVPDEEVIDFFGRRRRSQALVEIAEPLEHRFRHVTEPRALLGDLLNEAGPPLRLHVLVLPQDLGERADGGEAGQEFVARLDERGVMCEALRQRLGQPRSGAVVTAQPDHGARPVWLPRHDLLSVGWFECKAPKHRVGYELGELFDEDHLLPARQCADFRPERLRQPAEKAPAHLALSVLDQVQVARRDADPARQSRLGDAERTAPLPQSQAGGRGWSAAGSSND